MGNASGESARTTVRKCLKDSIWYVRMHAIRSLEKIPGPETIGDIAPLIKDDHWFIREAVKEAAIKHFSAALPFIEELIYDEDERVREACVEIIEKSGYADRILKDIISGDPGTAAKANWWLGAMIKSGAHFGLEGLIIGYPQGDRQKLLSAIAAIDKEKAEHISCKARRECTEP
jgi:hypothetical protein